MARTKYTHFRSTGAPAPRLRLRSASTSSSGTALVSAVNTSYTRNFRQNDFCSSCRNGGELSMCDSCKRSLCTSCVILPDWHTEEMPFKCPKCHLESGEKNKRSRMKYPFTVPGGAVQRDSFPICDEGPVVIISIRLASFSPKGQPPAVIQQILEPYLPGDVTLFDLPFNFATNNGYAKYRTLVRDLVKGLKTGRLKNANKFSVFITSHADPERGDIHHIPDNGGALPVNDILDKLLPSNLLSLIRERNTTNSNHLTFLVCGGMVLNNGSRSNVVEFVKDGPFSWAMAFSQALFQPAVGNLFLADVSIQWHIYGRHPKVTLRNHQAMGAHSDIYIFSPEDTPVRFIWSHPGRRPFGVPSLLQCPNKECGILLPWKKPRWKSAGDEIVRFTLTCRVCGLRVRYRKPKDMKLLWGTKLTKSERGDWYIQPV